MCTIQSVLHQVTGLEPDSPAMMAVANPLLRTLELAASEELAQAANERVRLYATLVGDEAGETVCGHTPEFPIMAGLACALRVNISVYAIGYTSEDEERRLFDAPTLIATVQPADATRRVHLYLRDGHYWALRIQHDWPAEDHIQDALGEAAAGVRRAVALLRQAVEKVQTPADAATTQAAANNAGEAATQPNNTDGAGAYLNLQETASQLDVQVMNGFGARVTEAQASLTAAAARMVTPGRPNTRLRTAAAAQRQAQAAAPAQATAPATDPAEAPVTAH
jgi:hypothetical protein